MVSPARRLFLQWLLLNALTIVGILIVWGKFHEHLHGIHLVGIPIIIAISAYGSGFAGWLCWQEGAREYKWILHRAEYLEHWAWVCAMVGILSSIAGMSIILSDSEPATIATRVTEGGGAIFYTTFAGVLAMLLLRHEHRMIEHHLGA